MIGGVSVRLVHLRPKKEPLTAVSESAPTGFFGLSRHSAVNCYAASPAVDSRPKSGKELEDVDEELVEVNEEVSAREGNCSRDDTHLHAVPIRRGVQQPANEKQARTLNPLKKFDT